MLDKIRLRAKDALPADYHNNLGTGSDGRVCRFLHVEYPALVERVLAGGTDQEILEWCFERGRKPSEEEIFILNTFLTKQGWRDDTTPELEEMKQKWGFADRSDIQTFFEFHKADESQ
jgi:gluconokinase